MAGVFKSLERSDVRLTPFRAYKLISLSGSNQLVDYIYEADYNPFSYYLNYDPLQDTFDLGNNPILAAEPTTSNGQYQRVVHRSLDHLYYRDFYSNTRAAFGGGNINYQYRYLEDKAKAISFSQTKFGEQILQGSVKVYVTYSVDSNNYLLEDDIYGNLHPSGGIESIYGTVVSGSISRQIIGEWPSDNVYKYLGEGVVNFNSDSNRGLFQHESRHTNLRAVNYTSSTFPGVEDMIGVSFRFSSSLNSKIEAGNFLSQDYHNQFSFNNGDFSICALIRPEANSTTAAGNVIITKAGPNHRLQIDLNGNLFTESIDRKTPYDLYYSASRVVFERNALYQKVRVVSSTISLNEFTHIAAIKTGSTLQLWIDGVLDQTATDVSAPSDCVNYSNIYIGNSYDSTRGFNGSIDNIKLYKGALTAADVALSYHTHNVGNVIVGNVFYTNGMVVLSSINSRYMKITQADVRGTQTIHETEILCTVSPGEYNRSMNRTLQQYNSTTNQFEFKDFATGSAFRPFVTTIGLYNDFHQLVAIGKLSTPIQLPTNIDTTFVIKFDRW
jgi:hypothetical protein